LSFERANSAKALSSLYGKFAGSRVGEVLGKENLGDILAGNTAGGHYRFRESLVAGLSVVCHTVKLSKKRWKK